MNLPRISLHRFILPLMLLALAIAGDFVFAATSHLPDGWTAVSPRDEIRPVFWFEPNGGVKHAGDLVIAHDQREGLDGWFQK